MIDEAIEELNQEEKVTTLTAEPKPLLLAG